jgi:hypothetical protein
LGDRAVHVPILQDTDESLAVLGRGNDDERIARFEASAEKPADRLKEGTFVLVEVHQVMAVRRARQHPSDITASDALKRHHIRHAVVVLEDTRTAAGRPPPGLFFGRGLYT